MAPMSLLSYAEARPWAKGMKAAVVTEKMPPWFADPNYGHFANDRRLSKAEIDTLVAWADNGAPEGDAKDAPPPRTFQDGWNIKPDMVIEMPKDFHVAATGTINYQNILVNAHFTEDTWVVAAEMRARGLTVHVEAVLSSHLHAFKILLHDEINDAGDRIRPIGRRCASGHHFDAVHHDRRNLIEIRSGIRIGRARVAGA